MKPAETTIGVRFKRTDAPQLRALAQRVRLKELPGQHANLFDSAADAAESGQPLLVRCSSPEDGLLIVQGFITYGVAPLGIDYLSPAHRRRPQPL